MSTTGPTSPPPDAPGVDAPLADDPVSQSLVEPGAGPVAARAAGRGMLRSSAVYSGLTLVSRFMGFLRDLVISARIGASATAAGDAYNTMLWFPNLFRRIFAEGAFATAFVPAYAKSLARDGEEVADVLAADALATLAAATVAVTVACDLAMPWLMLVISPGFTADPVKFKLAVTLTQISMPYLVCMAIYAHLAGVLQARGKFALSALAPTLLNAVMLAAVWPQHDAVSAAHAASWAVLGAGVLQAGLLWWGVSKSGARVTLRLPRLTPEIKALILLAVPGAIAASATQINIAVSGILASQVNGARSWLATADRLYQLPLGLVGVAIGVALLPRLSTTVQAKDEAGAQGAMDEAVTLSMALTLPAAAALVAIPVFLIDALFTRGAFLPVDARETASALLHYGWGVPAFVLARILNQGFFARQDTRTPMRFALISVAVNIVAGVGLFLLVGFQGIAAATSLAAWINVAQMVTTLRARGWWRPGPQLLSRLVRILLASAVMGGVLAVLSAGRPLIEPTLLGRKELALAVSCLAGGLLYLLLLPLTRAVTPAEVRGLFRRGRGGA